MYYVDVAETIFGLSPSDPPSRVNNPLSVAALDPFYLARREAALVAKPKRDFNRDRGGTNDPGIVPVGYRYIVGLTL